MALKILKQVSWETQQKPWYGAETLSTTRHKVFLKESLHFQGKLARYTRIFQLRPQFVRTELPVDHPDCLRKQSMFAENDPAPTLIIESGNVLLLTGRVVTIETTYHAENEGVVNPQLKVQFKARTLKETLLEALFKEHRVFIARHQIDLKNLVRCGGYVAEIS
ncbi:MAG: hypothetical protein WC761_00245 [Candidatus Paceibacterota bacterium]|jgi:hypothetical protein